MKYSIHYVNKYIDMSRIYTIKNKNEYIYTPIHTNFLNFLLFLFIPSAVKGKDPCPEFM